MSFDPEEPSPEEKATAKNSDKEGPVEGAFSDGNVRTMCFFGLLFLLGFYIAGMLPAVGSTGAVLNGYMFLSTIRNPRYFDGGLLWIMRMMSLSCFFYSFYFLTII